MAQLRSFSALNLSHKLKYFSWGVINIKALKFVVSMLLILSLLTISFTAGAASDEEGTYPFGMTKEQMIQYGYVFTDDGYYLPSGIIPPEAYFPSTMLLSSPKYPNFDPRKLPWSDAPTAVKEILSMDTSGANTTDYKTYKMPFVAIRVNSSEVLVMVGINCFLGVGTANYNARVCTTAGNYASAGFQSVCYTAKFSHKYANTSAWKQLEFEDWGSSGNIQTYNQATFIADDYNVDLYVSGGNGPRPNYDGNVSFTTINFTYSSSANIVCYANNRVGFTTSNLVLYGTASGHFPDVYVSLFNPPTIQEMEQETQKGILDNLKDLPNKIGGFFTSLKNYILYFSAEDPTEEQLNPFNNILTDVQSFFDNQFTNLTDFKNSLKSDDENSVKGQVIGWLDTSSIVIESFIGGTGGSAVVGILLTFVLIFLVVRKAVGR